MEQRARFVLEAQQGLFSITELCERYGVSRKTGYKWLDRYDSGGLADLADQSRSARRRPNATEDELVTRIVESRRKHKKWGPRKLRQRLERLHPEIVWPAASTIGAILKREGLVTPRPRRARSRVVWEKSRTVADAPNRVWSADFKGDFRLGNGARCYPLTIMDGHSRFLLRCDGLGSTAAAGARAVFDRVFREYGLPEVIRTDNGTPFSSPTALQGLSRLAVHWIKLAFGWNEAGPRSHRTTAAMNGCIAR
jgi:transposase InsO family protein